MHAFIYKHIFAYLHAYLPTCILPYIYTYLHDDPLQRHFMRTLTSLGIKGKTIRQLFGAWWSKVRPNKKEKTLIVKLQPIFEVLNGNIAAAIRALTYAEVKERFAKHDVWYTPVRVPAQLLTYEQAHATGLFVRGAVSSEDSQDLFVANPIALVGGVDKLVEQGAQTMPKAPAMGEHNGMSVEQMMKASKAK
jgi:hypothetical protein